MRWIFIGVVVLNLVYLGWHFAAGTAAAPAADEGQPQAFPASIALVRESPGTGAVAVPPAGQEGASGCPAAGPFPGAAEADAARAMLEAGGYASESRDVEMTDLPVFWVHLPAAETREEALRSLRELQGKGIDSFLVASGADVNAVSLGSFQNRDSATGVRDRLRAAGYRAEIREQRKTVHQYWVVLNDPLAQGFTERLPQDPPLQYQRLPCPAR